MSQLRKKAMALPLLPGVYIMHDKSGKIIYIGKAKALKNRVSQYFGSQNNHAEKVRRMVDNVDDFEYIITDSEFEALILECSLIKQHTPKYNILLKDDKGYSYIRISSGDWKKLSYTLQKKDDGAEYKLVGKVGAHHYQNIIPVRRVDQAAVIAAGIHGAAFAGYIDQIWIRVGFFGVGVIRGDAARQHGVVVLLAEHIAHGIAGLGADQLALCQQGKKAAHIPRGNGTQLFAPVIAAQAAGAVGGCSQNACG